ncbi:hypothetical protein Pta6605_39570 [Pseudomonas amygdali pv. tabaci]|nr:hypothetical protein Pta6605_39570 [Pseudomonas amygdali pv. tabaci]
MNAHRAIDIRVAFGECLDRTRIVGADTDAEKMPDPSATGGIEGCIQRAVVLGKVKAIKVTMGIYKHGLKHNYIVWVGRSDFRAPTR